MNRLILGAVSIILLFTPLLFIHAEVTTANTETPLQRTLKLGSLGDDVRELQQFLSQLIGAYPEGLVTGYFGRLTRAAVARFQAQMGIEPVGVVGPKTKMALNTLMLAAASASGQEHRSENANENAATPATAAEPNPGEGPATPAIPATPSRRARGNSGGGGGTGTTTPPEPPADTTPPVISNVTPNPSLNDVTISWTTNELSTSGILVSLTPDFSTTFASSSQALKTSHSLTLANLLPSTTYHYAVSSADAAGNVAASSKYIFTTLALPPPATTTPPVATTTPPVATTTPPIATTTPPVATTTPPILTKFQIGDRVWPTTTINVRSGPSISASIIGTQASSSLGTVIGGPTAADGFQWWQVNYDAGVDGWSVEDFLSKSTSSAPPTPPPPAPSLNWNSVLVPTTLTGTSMVGEVNMAASDTGYGLAWWVNMLAAPGGIYLTMINADGTRTSTSDVLVAGSGGSLLDNLGTPKIVWNGGEFGVFWRRFFARFAKDGTRLQANTTLTGIDQPQGRYSDVIWNGTNYAMFWQARGSDGAFRPAFALVSATGTIVKSATIISTDTVSQGQFMKGATNGNRYVVAWHDFRTNISEVYVAILDSTGTKVSTDIKVSSCPTGGDCIPDGVFADGTTFKIFWRNQNPAGRARYLTTINEAGQITGMSMISNDTNLGGLVGWAKKGNEYGTIWPTATSDELRFARFDGSGAQIGDTGAIHSGTRPTLVSTPQAYGAAWPNNGTSIFFTTGN